MLGTAVRHSRTLQHMSPAGSQSAGRSASTRHEIPVIYTLADTAMALSISRERAGCHRRDEE